jgi:hypothetical protein
MIIQLGELSYLDDYYGKILISQFGVRISRVMSQKVISVTMDAISPLKLSIFK